MELVVKGIDLRYTKNNEILKCSETLEGYSRLLYYIKQRKKEGVSLEEAIRYAISFSADKRQGGAAMLLQEITREEFLELRAKEAADDSFAD